MLEYGHNQMPFILFTRERLSRSIFDSRGIPELVATNQYVAKAQEDLRNDASQISVIPPLLVNARRGALNTIVAPASQMTISLRRCQLVATAPTFARQYRITGESRAIGL